MSSAGPFYSLSTMAKRRSKSILLVGLVTLSPFLVLLAILFLPSAFQKPPPPRGEIPFPVERPKLKTTFSETPHRGASLDKFYDSIDGLMTWDKNPWRIHKTIFGSHYNKLRFSKDPADQAKVAELQEWGDALYRRILERYPELAVEYKNIPPEKNGFLKWLEFCERHEDSDKSSFELPQTLQEQIKGKEPWDSALAKQWLTENQSLLNELREIGSMPEQSVKDIPMSRWTSHNNRHPMDAINALLLDARLSITEGDTATALESVHAARGLADHFSEIETPTFVGIYAKQQVTNYALNELIPAIPANVLQPSQWEEALNPQLYPPATLGRVETTHWHMYSQNDTLPMLSNVDDPHYPSDPDALIDYHASSYLQLQQTFRSEEVTDWQTTTPSPLLSLAHLSRNSREFAETSHLWGSRWDQRFLRFNNQNGLTQAAFALMRGEPVPNDPIHNQPYQWDPTTRELSVPDTPEFENLRQIKTITVPQVP